MPDFPRASSQRSLTTQQPEPFREEATKKTDVATKVLAATQKVAAKWDDALVISQLNAYKANQSVFLADVKTRAVNDPDQNNADKYIKEIEDYSKTALKGMSNRAKEAAGIELQTDTALAKIQVNGVFQKKIIVQAEKNLVTSLEGYATDIINAGTFWDRQKNILGAYALIDKNVETGIISPDTAKETKKKFTEAVRTGIIDQALYSNPEAFKKQVAEDPKYFSFENEKEKSDKLAKADKLIKADDKMLKWEATQINTLGAYKLSNALLDRTASPIMVKEMYRKGEIDFETAAIFDGILTTKDYEIPEDTKKSKPDFFLRLLDEALDDKTESLSIMKQAARAFGKNEIGANQYAYFIGEAQNRFNRQKRGEGWANTQIRGAVESLKTWAKTVNKSAAFSADILRNFLEKTQAGLSANDAATNVKEETQVNMNPNRANYKIGDPVTNPKTGKSYKVIGFYPDGEPDLIEVE